MSHIAAVGSSQFILGFQLAGVRETIELHDNIFQSLKELRKNQKIVIVIVEESMLARLAAHERMEIESSIEPVFVALSTTVEQDSLRRLIKKSVGIDLWR